MALEQPPSSSSSACRMFIGMQAFKSVTAHNHTRISELSFGRMGSFCGRQLDWNRIVFGMIQFK